MGRNSAEATNACLIRAVRAARADLPARVFPFLADFVDFVVFLALVEAAAEPALVCADTGDKASNAARTPQSQRAASGLEFGEFTTLIHSLYAEFAFRAMRESQPVPSCAP
jgi:hypothetical protein